MIVIRVEMWPCGDPSRSREFGRAKIYNKLDTTLATGGQKGDYAIELRGGVWGTDSTVTRMMSKVWRKDEVKNFNRVREGLWHLLFKGLAVCLSQSGTLPEHETTVEHLQSWLVATPSATIEDVKQKLASMQVPPSVSA